MGTNARGAGFETRVTLLDTDATVNYTSSPTYLHSRLIFRNNVANNWLGNFVSQDSIGQSGYCQDDCEVRQFSYDGDAVLGDTYKVQVEILPVLNPCTGCTISCDGDFAAASTAGCTANPGGSNCVTITFATAPTALTSTCTTSSPANKIRIDLTSHSGIICAENCLEQFIIDDSYLMVIRNPGVANDQWLSTGTSIQIDLKNLQPFGTNAFTLEIMAVTDDFPVTI